MKCPYYGRECGDCEGVCVLDSPRPGYLSIKLGDFNCECGAKIATPVSSCRTPNCRFSHYSIYKKESIINGIKIRTIELPDGTFRTVAIGGKYCGETWDSPTIIHALAEHDKVVQLLRLVV